MNTFKTIEEAREHASKITGITHILEIEPGRVDINPYICAKCDEKSIAAALKRKPMPEIKYIKGVAADLLQEKYEKEKIEKHKNIPGLNELESIIADWDYYMDAQSAMMEDEMNDGINPPKRPSCEVAAIAKQYPVAAAYIKAENWGLASNYAKSAAGNKAKKKIAAGVNYLEVLAQMEQAWSAHCDKYK